MKARALRGAVAKHPKVWIRTRFGPVNLEKQSLLIALRDLEDETNVSITDTGQLTADNPEAFEREQLRLLKEKYEP